MKNKLFYTALGATCVVLAAVAFVKLDTITPPATAEASKRVVTNGNDLFLASDTIGSKQLTTNENIKTIFSRKENLLLVGKGYEETIPNNPNSAGSTLYLFNEDGTPLRKVSDKIASYGLLDRKGENIVYLTPAGEIFHQSVANGKERKVATLASIPSISPDGKQIAYKKMPEGWTVGQYADGAKNIVVVDIATGNERVLTEGEADHAAYWTPDGNYVYFFGDNGYGMDSLFMINSDGSNRTLLTNIDKKVYVPGEMVPSISEPPIISSDGSYFIYESDREIWVVHVDLNQRKVIESRRIGYGVNPEWSEDGKTLSVVFGGNGKSDATRLIVMDVDGNIIKK